MFRANPDRRVTTAHPDAGVDIGKRPELLIDAEEDWELVDLYLALGATRLKFCGPYRDDWDFYMERQFGERVLPHLDVLFEAVQRIARKEPFDGLPLPDEVQLKGAVAYEV